VGNKSNPKAKDLRLEKNLSS